MTHLTLKALIDEHNCIGCTKCLTVCPTDAIIGAKKKIHTVIPNYCTSCKKCITACPTNCIHLATPGEALLPKEEMYLTTLKNQRLQKNNTTHLATISSTSVPLATKRVPTLMERKKQVADAIRRVKARKKKII